MRDADHYNFTPTITLDQDYDWTLGPTFNPALPATGNASVNTTVDITITGNIQYNPCYTNVLYYSSSATCPTAGFTNFFMDNSNLCSATKIWTQQSDCGTTNYAPSGYYKTTGNQVRNWNGSSFNGNCSNC